LGGFPPPIFGLCGDLDKDRLTLKNDPVDVKIGQLADVAGQAADLILMILKELAVPTESSQDA